MTTLANRPYASNADLIHEGARLRNYDELAITLLIDARDKAKSAALRLAEAQHNSGECPDVSDQMGQLEDIASDITAFIKRMGGE